ncbi:protein NINJA homolog 1-like [Musa acuminata AAA Group]|uniref:protein NINJA homolog 1-like n=1 Tax=Musa acuminata AAA Group TaxID=214697 RepID=UPI0031DFF74B
MEDENGLELSLGLSFGGSSGKSKSRDVSLDHRIDEGSCVKTVGSSSMAASDVPLKNFFQTNAEDQEHSGKQAVPQPRENFWTDLNKFTVSVSDGSDNKRSNQLQFMGNQEPFIANSKTTNSEEDNSGAKKRRLTTEEMNFQKKHVSLVDHSAIAGKGPSGDTFVKLSHNTPSMDDGCSGENDDVEGSEAEGSNSWLVSQREDSFKHSDLPKGADKSASSGISHQGQKQQLYSGNESNPGLGKVAHGIPLSLQPLTVMTVPYPIPVEVPPAASVPNTVAFPSPCVMQLMPVANSEQPVVQAVNTNNSQMAFGYSTVQLPRLETNSSWAFGSQSQLVSSSTTKNHADGGPDSQHAEPHVRIPHGSSSALALEGRSTNSTKGGKHVIDTGTSSSSHVEDEAKGINTVFWQSNKANPDEGHEGSQIRPGAAPNVKFGGCGSYPDLPWVSTTGPGPNGRTISGVTYKYTENQIKIVCACHGYHMSPGEFVRHASADAADAENSATLAPFATTNPATSAQN